MSCATAQRSDEHPMANEERNSISPLEGQVASVPGSTQTPGTGFGGEKRAGR